MTYVYDQAKADALVDRGCTVLLAAIEVGPHIKPLRAATGVPEHFILNASWYLRRAGVWEAKKLNYDWLSAYMKAEPAGVEGLTNDAGIAAGLGGTGSAYSGAHVWTSAQRPGRHKSGKWQEVPPPACGTSIALSRHRRGGEVCEACQTAEDQRRVEWVARRARIQEKRKSRLAPRPVDSFNWSSLLEDDPDTRLVKQAWGQRSLDAPLLWANDDGDRTEYDRVAAQTGVESYRRYEIEWLDPVHDDAKPELDEWSEGRRIIRATFPEGRGVADEMVNGFSEGRTFAQKKIPRRHSARR